MNNAIAVTRAILAIALVLAPGAGMVLLLRPTRSLWSSAALAPAAGFGVTAIVAELASVAGIAVRWWSVLPTAYAALGVTIAWAARRSRVAERAQPMAKPAARRDGLDARSTAYEIGGLAALAVVSLTVGLMLTHGATAVPPNDDGTHHALFATAIMRSGSIDAHRLVVGDLVTGQPSLSYYPFGLHIVAALTATIAHVPVAAALDLTVLLALAIALPLGMFACTRIALPTLPGAGLVASAAAVSFPLFPGDPLSWGGLPLVVGTCLVPGVAAAACDRGATPWVASGLCIGLGVVGLFAVHNSEIVTVIVMTGALIAVGRRLVRPRLLDFKSIAVACSVLAIFVLPQVHALLNGASSRVGIVAVRTLTVSEAAHQALFGFFDFGPRHLTLPLLVVFGFGLLVALVRFRLFGVLGGYFVIAALTFAAAVHRPWGVDLTIPWYSVWSRVMMNQTLFVPIVIAAGVVAAVRVIRRPRPRPTQRVAVVALGAGASGLLLLPLWHADARQEHATFTAASIDDADTRSAFTFLKAHVKPGERVLNDFAQGSGWMWVDAHVPPLFPLAVQSFSPATWGSRLYLLDHAAGLATDRRAQEAALTWDVGWAYVCDRVFPLHRPVLSTAALLRSGAWQEVFSKGPAHVFKRVA